MDKRCGTCKWWAGHIFKNTDQVKMAACEWPVPIWMQPSGWSGPADAGEGCKTWAPNDGEQWPRPFFSSDPCTTEDKGEDSGDDNTDSNDGTAA